MILDYTLRNVVLGAAILGVVGGMLGTFAVLRRQSLLGDALAHAALPGICLMFILTGTKTPELILLGAAISGWVGTLVLLAIVRGTRLKEDAALGTVLTVFFGLGILLLTRIQRGDNANQSGLDRYLFGQAATLLERDIVAMAVLGAAALGVLALLYKEFKLLSFDPAYAASLGFPTGLLDVLLTSLIVVAVLIGLQTVGVVLMVAMLIAPAAAARQWTDRLGPMLALSAGFGAAAGLVGAVLSSTAARVPTGPLIVLAATVLVLFSLLFAPRHGMVGAWLRQREQRRRLAATHLLAEVHGVLVSRLSPSVNGGTPVGPVHRRSRPGPAPGIPAAAGAPSLLARFAQALSQRVGGGRPNPPTPFPAREGGAFIENDSPFPAREGGRGVRSLAATFSQTALAGLPFQADEVAAVRGHTAEEVRRGLRGLARRGHAVELRPGCFSLTPVGAAEAGRAARHQRLWQAYLAHQLELPVDAVHLDVGDLERALPPEVIDRLELATLAPAASQMGEE